MATKIWARGLNNTGGIEEGCVYRRDGQTVLKSHAEASALGHASDDRHMGISAWLVCPSVEYVLLLIDRVWEKIYLAVPLVLVVAVALMVAVEFEDEDSGDEQGHHDPEPDRQTIHPGVGRRLRTRINPTRTTRWTGTTRHITEPAELGKSPGAQRSWVRYMKSDITRTCRTGKSI